MALTREDITITLGELDDATIAEIMDSGADADELARAVSIVRDGELLHVDHTASRQRVMGLCEVIPSLSEPGPDFYDAELPFTD